MVRVAALTEEVEKMAGNKRVHQPWWLIRWALVSVVGFAVGFMTVFVGGWALVEAVTGNADRVLDDGWGFWIQLTVGFSVAGALAAAGQWLLLRRRGSGGVRWVLGAGTGFAVVAVLYLALYDRVPLVANEIVHNLAGGALLGAIQAPIVHRLTGRARPWVLVTAGAMLLAGTVAATGRMVGLGDDVTGPLGILAAAVVTGFALSRWLTEHAVVPTLTGPDREPASAGTVSTVR